MKGVGHSDSTSVLRLAEVLSFSAFWSQSSADQISLLEEQLPADLPTVEANSVSGREVEYRIVAGDQANHFTHH